MLDAQVLKRFGGGLVTTCFYIFITPPDTLNSFLKVLARPLQVFRQCVVERRGGVLAAMPGVFLQLCFAFRLNRYEIHAPSLGGEATLCQRPWHSPQGLT